ncbi:MAG: acyl carrier protein [Lachnospiraceae bacterium]|nr:acyl carrier protein [Lachnospiraceae bacterium]
MDREELEQQVIELVAMAYGKDAADVNLGTRFVEDLAGASIQMVGLVSEIENELDVMVQLQVAAACKTVEELVDKVEEQL